MKNIIKKITLLICILVTLTGCVTFEASMDIKRNKKMDFKVLVALDEDVYKEMGEDGLESSDEEFIDVYKEHGFSLEDYKEDGKVGYLLSKKFDNIDDVSTVREIEFDFEDYMDTNGKDNIFTVKKGFLKNTYKAKIKIDINTNTGTDDLDSSSELENKMKNSFDYRFEMKLPYSAISNNATSTKNNNKELTWDLLSSDMDNKNCEVEFYVYNMTTIYIIAGCILLIILLIILSVISEKKRKKKNEPKISVSEKEEVVEEVQVNNPVEEQVIDRQSLVFQGLPSGTNTSSNSSNDGWINPNEKKNPMPQSNNMNFFDMYMEAQNAEDDKEQNSQNNQN